MTFRFKVGLSFSGVRRTYVSQVADILALLYGREAVLYDLYHKGEFSRADLPTYLGELYANQTVVNAIFVSEETEMNTWTGWEYQVAIQRLLGKTPGSRDDLMIFNFERHSLSILPYGGYIDCDTHTPAEVAGFIRDRVESLLANIYIEESVGATQTLVNRGSVKSWGALPRLGVFIGRRGELVSVVDALRPERRSWGCVIAGPGGLGKTSLAIRAAESCDEHSFDSVIFVSAKVEELGPQGIRRYVGRSATGAVELFKDIAGQLGSGGRSWGPIPTRPAEVLALLADRSALLILDNLETFSSSDQRVIFDFLNNLPRQCKAIVTTRQAKHAEAKVVTLGALAPEDSLALLEEVGEVNPLLIRASIAERNEVAERSGGNPLLLKWIVGQLGSDECRSIDLAIERLERAQPVDDPIGYIFRGLVDGLDDDCISTLGALYALGSRATQLRILRVAGLSSSNLTPTLNILANRLLIQEDVDTSSYWLPSLTGQYVDRFLGAEVGACRARMADWSVELLDEFGRERFETFGMLDENWDLISAALPTLLELPNDELQQVYSISRQYLGFTGRWDERRALSVATESLAIAEGDYRLANWRAYDIGMIHYRRGEGLAAIDVSVRMEDHARHIEPDSREAMALAFRVRGLARRQLGELTEARDIGIESVRLFEQLGRSKDYACALNAVGVTFRLMGEPEQSYDYSRLALEVAQEVGSREYEADYLGNLADLVIDRAEWTEARRQVQHALALSLDIGRVELIARNELRLARVEAGDGRLKEARTLATSALERYASLGMPQVSDVLQFLGTLVSGV
jgi:tetratricopeptide (TPR) repeat protein